MIKLPKPLLYAIYILDIGVTLVLGRIIFEIIRGY